VAVQQSSPVYQIRRVVGGLLLLQVAFSVVYAAIDAFATGPPSHATFSRAAATVPAILWPFSGPAAFLLLPQGYVLYVVSLVPLLALLLIAVAVRREVLRRVLLGTALGWWLLSSVSACGAAYT
jgi:hypothetical protein